MNFDQIVDEQLGPNQSIMAALDKSGDTKIIWDRTKPAEVEAARASFDALKKKGYAAYAVKGEEGKKGAVLHSFDPDVERVILAPQMIGG